MILILITLNRKVVNGCKVSDSTTHGDKINITLSLGVTGFTVTPTLLSEKFSILILMVTKFVHTLQISKKKIVTTLMESLT